MARKVCHLAGIGLTAFAAYRCATVPEFHRIHPIEYCKSHRNLANANNDYVFSTVRLLRRHRARQARLLWISFARASSTLESDYYN
jgi:hypothetical protein